MNFVLRAQTLMLVIISWTRLARAEGQCYLDDTESECALCWITLPGQVPILRRCPEGLILAQWITPPPRKLVENQQYQIEYSLAVSSEVSSYIIPASGGRGSLREVWHANLHSCVRSRGACTPFVSDNPGLSTHSRSTASNLSTTSTESFETATFSEQLALPEESYVIIAHLRVTSSMNIFDNTTYTACSASSPEQCAVYDIAIGKGADVEKKPINISYENAYTYLAAVVTVLLVVTSSFVWALYTNKLDRCFKAIFNDTVKHLCQFLLSCASTTAYTISFRTVVLKDERLMDFVPLGYFCTIVGWISLLVSFVFLAKHTYDDRNKQILRTKAVLAEEKSRYLQHSNKVKARRRLEILVSSCQGMLFRDIPFIATQFYVLSVVSSSSTAALFSLMASGISLGLKSQDMLRLPKAYKNCMKASQNLRSADISSSSALRSSMRSRLSMRSRKWMKPNNRSPSERKEKQPWESRKKRTSPSVPISETTEPSKGARDQNGCTVNELDSVRNSVSRTASTCTHARRDSVSTAGTIDSTRMLRKPTPEAVERTLEQIHETEATAI
uniref:Transmembrane protein n=1 Tax=Lotharella globosa TaxID=91324 RepID=A0A7S3YFC9_9EUKA|mmetsp:Transcript_1228/g.2316  ORF Transcript_1228/g.2316 Transcript_1228/m.2316 type:complete len:559 (+) Transcript_1228:88-1764(+)